MAKLFETTSRRSRFLHDNEFAKSLASVVIKATVPVSDVLLIVERDQEEARGESG